MESKSLSSRLREERDKEIAKDQAAQRKMDRLREFNIKSNVGGSILLIGFCLLLYTAGDYINRYINVVYPSLAVLLICGFLTLKYFYLAWFTDDDD